MFHVVCITTGHWRQNGYVVTNGQGEALLIDPGAEPERYEAALADAGLRPVGIINTHAHYDHIGAVKRLVTRFDLPFYMHGRDAGLLRQANLYRRLFGAVEPIDVPDGYQDLADKLPMFDLDHFTIAVLTTPGHTKGSVCFRIGDEFFSGDTLLSSGAGRSDLPGGSATELDDSLRALAELPPDLRMHPGHGTTMTLGEALARVPAQGRSSS